MQQNTWIETLSIDDLERSIRCRETIDLTYVEELAQVLRDGGELDPISVVRDGDRNIVWDGSHRIGAHVDAGRNEIACEVREGTRRDAILLAAAANGKHGLKRSRADKRECVWRVLELPDSEEMSDREIARIALVSHTFVAECRREFAIRHGGNNATDDDHDWNARPEKPKQEPRGDNEEEPEDRLPGERSAPARRDPQSGPPAAPAPATGERPSAQRVPMDPQERAALVLSELIAAVEANGPTGNRATSISIIAGAIEAAMLVVLDEQGEENRRLRMAIHLFAREYRTGSPSELRSAAEKLCDIAGIVPVSSAPAPEVCPITGLPEHVMSGAVEMARSVDTEEDDPATGEVLCGDGRDPEPAEPDDAGIRALAAASERECFDEPEASESSGPI